jgi:hypothetical protein
MEGCGMYCHLTTSVTIIHLQPFLNEYCMNPERHKECARYQIIEGGKEPPANLLPDGKMLKS